jgi:hypothetical protein
MIGIDGVETTKPARIRSPRNPSAQASRTAGKRVAKRSDASKTKVSLYLDVQVANKLTVRSVLLGKDVDASDVANEILARALSSVTFYDPSIKQGNETLTNTGIGHETAA